MCVCQSGRSIGKCWWKWSEIYHTAPNHQRAVRKQSPNAIKGTHNFLSIAIPTYTFIPFTFHLHNPLITSHHFQAANKTTHHINHFAHLPLQNRFWARLYSIAPVWRMWCKREIHVDNPHLQDRSQGSAELFGRCVACGPICPSCRRSCGFEGVWVLGLIGNGVVFYRGEGV